MQTTTPRAIENIFSSATIAEARLQAQRSGRSLIESLESNSGLDAASFLAGLANAARLPALNMEILNRLQPAFERVNFTLAAQRQCLPVRDDHGKLLLIIADPFDTALSDWAMEYLTEPFVLYLAHRTDIQAYLARYEENLRAMDGSILSQAEMGESISANVENLSCKASAAIPVRSSV